MIGLRALCAWGGLLALCVACNAPHGARVYFKPNTSGYDVARERFECRNTYPELQYDSARHVVSEANDLAEKLRAKTHDCMIAKGFAYLALPNCKNTKEIGYGTMPAALSPDDLCVRFEYDIKTKTRVARYVRLK